MIVPEKLSRKTTWGKVRVKRVTNAYTSPLFRSPSSISTQPPKEMILQDFLKGFGRDIRSLSFWNPSVIHTPQLWQLASAVPLGLPIPARTSSTPWFSLLTAFLLGGLFFSTVMATVSACYAIGIDNVRYLATLLQAVGSAVWTSFTAALSTAKAALRGESTSWQWRRAWQVLQQELRKTRQTAVEGVASLRQEAALYAGVVGAPGLIPLQYLVDHFLPYSIAGALEQGIQDNLINISKQTKSIQKIKLTRFDVGSRPPRLDSARVYDLDGEGVAFDAGMEWKSTLKLQLTVYLAGGLARIPVEVQNVQFHGVLRVILTPLCKTPPGYGAALISFPQSPTIGLDVRVAGGDITRIPWLRSELVAAIKKGIQDECLWPKRVVVPTLIGKRPILSDTELAALANTDPLLLREEILAQERPLLQRQQRQPKWSREQFKVFVNRPDASDYDNEQDENVREFKTSTQIEKARMENGVLPQLLVQALLHNRTETVP